MKQTKEQLQSWARRIHGNAKSHGWHEKEMPTYHWLGMIMTEVAEAIEADRNGRRADMESFNERMSNLYGSDECFKEMYKIYIKGSIEEEFADICIRILDTAYELHGEYMEWFGYDYPSCSRPFTVMAFVLVKEILNTGMMNLTESISYMFAWAENLGIDLSWHIEHKMVYNELRSYKHGGKAY